MKMKTKKHHHVDDIVDNDEKNTVAKFNSENEDANKNEEESYRWFDAKKPTYGYINATEQITKTDRRLYVLNVTSRIFK